jgi:predicted GNAT superfamily acetyltransferase
MKSRSPQQTDRPDKRARGTLDGITIRHCHGIEEFEGCIRVERAVWKSSDIDVVPVPLFVVASETGGQVLGAFLGAEIVGFTLALAGWRDRRPYLHSHMTAVLEGYRDCGVGRRLKLLQREDALAHGIGLVEWTFDPLIAKNAHFNFARLGAIARRYMPNAYGITTSPLHASLPTDRLVAEWHLKSRRVTRVLAGKKRANRPSKRAARITIPSNIDTLRKTRPSGARELQSAVHAEFLKWFRKGYVVVAILASTGGMDYILEPGSAL